MATTHLDLDSLMTLRVFSAKLAEQNGGRAPNGCGYRSLDELTKTYDPETGTYLLRSVKIANATLTCWRWWGEYLDRASASRRPEARPISARDAAIRADVEQRIAREKAREHRDTTEASGQ